MGTDEAAAAFAGDDDDEEDAVDSSSGSESSELSIRASEALLSVMFSHAFFVESCFVSCLTDPARIIVLSELLLPGVEEAVSI